MIRLRASALLLIGLTGLAGCHEASTRHLDPIPPRTLSLMAKAGMSPADPILIRAYKKESEMEVWKRGPDGRWRVRLEHGERWTELWADETCSWLQVFTGEPKRGASLAVEPMTCGPDAFNPGPTSAALRVLEPGETYVGRWGINGR